ncbi:MAG TPA: phosphate/phosphite/phosphonate ABC transporter substrate-binding protein [Pirellulales bacterium]|jgi:phosphonate transport system substrate-binding protein|nr:phosphate/phosphite/phosphonate ABC transporter substrate-binding protein [Pirellulales bacterium]
MSSAPQPSVPQSSFSFARVVTLLVLAVVVIGVVYVVKSREWEQPSRQKESTMLAQMGFGTATPMTLDPQYTDADGDLVADPPKDPAQQIDPDKIVFSFIGSDAADEERVNWKEFADFLSKKIGKPVEVVAFKNREDEMQAMRDGKLQVAGFNTGNVQLAVNTCGFVPVCAPGREDGSIVNYTSQIIVPAGSSLHSLQDLKGQTITFTDRTSNAGYKAALILLKDRDLLPQRDYNCRFSMSYQRSIDGVSAGQYQAAAVASDMLQRAVAGGAADLAKLQVIDQSKGFPPATLGYVYNLKPELAEKIRAAMLEFSWSGTGIEKQFAGTLATKFVPVSYKNDFEWARIVADAVRDPPDVAIEKNTVSQSP